eukprot:TRINITY_DN1594_c0_g1_i3.p1 TRINITY_DN1594_c0_g1~~TRINITY_DN1594_c0_g1_i3.p1  ORF type:complete len:108 (-),score=4.29 TRINITY_DN1594_c0_g1_i3:278-601(-)
MAEHAAYTMAALTATGGVMGYLKARSFPSLMAGLTFSALFAGSGYLIAHSATPERGHGIAAGSSLVLAGVMVSRTIRTGKTLPAGAIAGVSILSAAYQGAKVYSYLK